MKTDKLKLKSAGFTLAEILITLGIIGVVAALTIPVIMQNIQTNQYKVAYKKAYTVLTNALMSASANNLLEYATASYAPEHWRNFATIMSYIKTQKTCLNYNGSGSVGDNTQCWQSGAEGWNMAAGGYPSTVDMTAIDMSGMTWGLCALGYGALYAVDTNGFKEPNQMGKDRFVFYLRDSAGNYRTGLPIKVAPFADNQNSICDVNKCGTVGDPDYGTYYGTTWLRN